MNEAQALIFIAGGILMVWLQSAVVWVSGCWAVNIWKALHVSQNYSLCC